MEVIDLSQLKHPSGVPSCVATIGFFDGVHLGHQYLLSRVAEDARRHGLASAVITFSDHPRQVLQSDFRPQLLTTTEERLALLSTTGIGYCVVLPFTRDLSSLSARAFMDEILRQTVHVKRLHIGYDHRFGHDRTEGFDRYVAYGRELGIEVVREDGLRVADLSHDASLNVAPETALSSSLIRRLLLDGRVQEASLLLGRPYHLAGRVVNGEHEGRHLGYPTANIDLQSSSKLVPAAGAYSVIAVEGAHSFPPPTAQCHHAMMNIGTRPTFGDGHPQTLEVHILNYSGNLYDQHLSVFFVDRLRGEKRFDSLAELTAQLDKDVIMAEQQLNAASKTSYDNESPSAGACNHQADAAAETPSRQAASPSAPTINNQTERKESSI